MTLGEITWNFENPPYTLEVGTLCAAWSFFELVTDDILWGILGIEPNIGSMISSQKDIVGRWSLILQHAPSKVTEHEMEIFRKINKALVATASDRNIVVHGQIMIQEDTNTTYAKVTRGANAGNFHFIDADTVKLIRNNIINLCHSAGKIGWKYQWLKTYPAGPIITDWVKPIEVFQ